jgi:hypothetical protein
MEKIGRKIDGPDNDRKRGDWDTESYWLQTEGADGKEERKKDTRGELQKKCW